MEDTIYKAISGWAGIPTWYTSHPLDDQRFNEAMQEVIATAGKDFTSEQFENALRRHVANTPVTLGAPKEWGNLISEFTTKAMVIVEYEASK